MSSGGGGVGVLHDGEQGSHAQPMSEATASTNYRQIGTRHGHGRLLLGAAHSYHAASVAQTVGDDAAAALAGSVPSIPSRFETVLYAGDQEPDAFLSRVSRFKSVSLDLPGPGSYAAGDVASNSSLSLQSSSFSSKGYGVGFVSKASRFQRRGGGPGPGAYATDINTVSSRAGSAPNRGAALSSTAAFRSTVGATLDPRLSKEIRDNVPGPGAYATTPQKTVVLTAPQQRRIASKAAGLHPSTSASALAASLQNTLGGSLLSPHTTDAPEAAFNSRDTRFRSPGFDTSSAGPADYSPNIAAVKPTSSAHTALFKSQTARTDFTSSRAEVPGPGAYQEEKTPTVVEDAPYASPTRAFKVTGVDRFGHVKEPRLTRDSLPGPGAYDPFIPVRSDSPLRGGPSSMIGRAKHPVPSPTSPLAASLAHGLPVRASGGSPESRISHERRKKRAAGVGGPGKSLLATRGGPGVVLNSPQQVLRAGLSTHNGTTFGRAGATSHTPSPAAVASASVANQPAVVSKESAIRPPGPAFYNPADSFHHVQDRKAFHLNTNNRWM